LFPSRDEAERAAERLKKRDMRAAVTTTLGRFQYWAKMLD
jgi:hypothetical protein